MNIEEARIAYVACPLCESADFSEHRLSDCAHHPLYRPSIPSRMRWLRCTNCGHVFIEGYFSPSALDVIFADANPHQLPGHNWHGARAVSARMVEKVIAEAGAANGWWLDVGFGNGALLGAAQEYGFEPIGLDLRRSNVELMRQSGIEAHDVEFTEFSTDHQIHVISMADVLEHMPFPKPALRHANEILVDNGVLFISLPNRDCYVWQQLDRLGQNPYWGELEHYHNFGRRQLERLLEEHGFAPVRYGISERYYMCMEVIARKRR